MPKDTHIDFDYSGHSYYKALIDNSLSAIFFTVPDGTILEANDAATEMFGYSKEEFRKIGRKGIIDHSDTAIQKILSERKEKGRVKGELTGIRKNGEKFPIEFSSSVFLDNAGKEFTCTTINDISERKKIEREINLMINNTEEAFILVNKDLKILSYNRKFEKIYLEVFGLPIIKGSSILDYAQPSRKEIVREIYRRVLTGVSEESQLAFELPTGVTKSYLIKYIPAKDEQDKIMGVFVTAQDITITKEQEQQTLALNKQLQQRSAFIESILQYLPIGIAVNRIDDGKATLLNKRFSEIYGWPEEDFLDVASFFQKVYPDETYRNEIVSKIIADIESRDMERMKWNNITITTQTEEKRIINAMNIPVYDQNLMISTVLDVTKESQQAAAINRAKTNQEALINGTKDMIWSVDTQLKIITRNLAYSEIMKTVTGRDLKEGDPVLIEAFGTEVLSRWKEYYSRALSGESFMVKEKVFNPVTQSMLYSVISFSPMYNDEGKVFGTACYSRDMTQETLSMQALEYTKDKLSKVMDSSLDIICTVNGEGTFIQMSKACEAVWGYTPEELVGRKFRDFIYPDDLPATEGMIDLIMTGNNMTYIKNRYVHKNGTIVPMEWSARWDPNEQLRYAVGRDVSEKIQAENALIESEKKYKDLFENNPSPMIIWDFETKQIVDCNTEAVLKYGYTKEEFIRLNITDIRPAEDIHLIEEVTQNETVYGQIHKNIWRHKKKNGEIMIMDLKGHLIDYNNRRASLVILNDITEKIETEERLIQSEAFLSEAQRLAKMGSWNYDFRLDKLTWSDALYSVFGTDKSIFLETHQSFIELIDEEDKDRVLKVSTLAQKTGDPFKLEYHITTPSGEKRIIEEFGYGEKDAEENIIRLFGTAQDITERKLLESKQKEILEQQSLFVSIVNSSDDAIISKTLDGKITSWNKGAEKIFGYTEKEAVGKNIMFIIPDNLKHEEAFIIEKMKKGEHLEHYETQRVRKDGHLLDISLTVSPILDLNGNVVGASKVARDITERKKAEQIINETNQRYEYVTRATFDAVWDWDIPTGKIFWGENYYRIFGYMDEAGLSDIRNVLKRVHPDEKLMIANSAKATLQSTATIWEYEHRFLKSDGTYAFVSNNALIIRDTAGKPIRVIGAMQDITKRIKEEQHLRLLESVITNTHDAVLITEAEPVDEPGPRIVYINEAFTQMTGYTAEEVIGKSPRILQGPKSDRKELAKLKKALQNWEACEITTVNYKKNGEEFWINFSVSPVANESGWYTHWISIERDVTQRKIEELQKEFFTDLSFLFNQPLELKEILKNVLIKTAQYYDMNAGEIWLTSSDKNKITQMATYADSEQSALFFSESADTKNLKKGEGLAGAPWETGNILFLNNVDEMKNFIRRGAAVKAGLRSACGIPLLHNNDIVGGLMFWVRESCFDEEKFKTLFQKLSSHISAEIKRKQLEQELNRVFRVAPDIICIMGNDGYFKKINPALSEMLGYTEEELLSKPFAELIHPDDRSITIQKTESLLNGKKSLLFENRYRAKSGRYLWISWTATPVNDEELVFAVGKNVTERKELEALLQKASSMARIGAWEFDLIHQTLSWSVITREIHEVAPDYLPDVKTIIHFYAKGESRESIIRAIRNAIENGESWDLDLHIITAMGNNRWVRSIGEAECIDGKCSRIFGSIQDIDSIKRGQEVVTQTLKEKNMILESIGDAFFAIDNSWLITYWNHMAEMVMNKNREEVLGRFFGEVFAEIGNLSFFTNFTEAVQKHETRHFEVYFQNQDAWYDVSTYPSESGLSVYFKDISYRKKAEKEIQESNERYNLAAKATNDIIWDWDLVKDVIIRSEDNMEKLLGYTNEAAKAINFIWLNLIHPDDVERVKEKIETVLHDPEKLFYDDEYRLRKANGEYAYLYDKGYVMRDETGKAIRVIGSIQDITKLKENEFQLKKRADELAISNLELEQFAFVASHDLQEPLRMITSFLSQLDNKYNDVLDEKAKKYIYFAVDGAKRMRQIVLDLLEFSRVGRFENTMEDLDLEQILKEIEILLHKKIKEKNAEILIDPLPVIHSYKAPIRQVFQNLISNALKYSKADTPARIHIAVTRTQKEWLFSVADNGIGIHSDYFEKVFILFQRLHNKNEYSGTGIGLAVSKKIIENLGGKIWIESKEGEGSTFYFTLPVQEKFNPKNGIAIHKS